VWNKLYNILLSSDKNLVKQLRKILGFTPGHLHFYKLAFTHKSYQQPKHQDTSKSNSFLFNNERLEFLGDAILDAVMAEYLFKKYPTQDEGFLTQMRSKLVNRKTLNKIASDMELDLFLKQKGSNKISQTMMGNTLEAFLGAVYLDVGFEKTKTFIIHRILKKFLDIHELEQVNDNYKSILLEFCQKFQKQVQYVIVEQSRTHDNREKFCIAVHIDDEFFGQAVDFNKKSAEQNASKNALIQLGLLDNHLTNQQEI